MKALAVAAVLLLVLVAGIVDWIDGNNDPAPGKRVVRLWEDNWNRGNYTVPECAKHWPSTCPGTPDRSVPKCAQHWPTTCREEKQ
jgi:hypothetical protein